MMSGEDACGRAGTPEFMTLVWKFVKNGYAVVAMSARRGGDQWRCYETRWPPEEWQELPGVRCPPSQCQVHQICN